MTSNKPESQPRIRPSVAGRIGTSVRMLVNYEQGATDPLTASLERLRKTLESASSNSASAVKPAKADRFAHRFAECRSHVRTFLAPM
jgi:hypothetical protein